MSIYSRFKRAASALRHEHHKGLGNAELDADQADDGTIPAVIWVLIDSQGRYVADAEKENLGDEYAYQVGKPDLGEALQIVQFHVRLPVARAVVVNAAGEACLK